MRPADTVAAAVGGADLVVIMVATPGQAGGGAVRARRSRPGSLAAGSIVVVMATVGPEAVISVAERLAAGGVAVVDAPVSGGTARAASGDLLIMVSGPQGPVERAQPVLSALARSAPVVGSSPGDGQRMKLVNQLLCGVHIAAAAEALAFAEALGLTAADCWQVLREGAAASFMLDDRGARMVEGQFDRPAARWTSSSRTWDWWARRPDRPGPRRRWPPPRAGSTSAATTWAWAASTTPC